ATATSLFAPEVNAASAAAGKVTICHIPPGNPGNAHTITVGASAVPAHQAHGDTLGACGGEGGGAVRIVGCINPKGDIDYYSAVLHKDDILRVSISSDKEGANQDLLLT